MKIDKQIIIINNLIIVKIAMFITLLMQLLGLKKKDLLFYGRRLLKYNLFFVINKLFFWFFNPKK